MSRNPWTVRLFVALLALAWATPPIPVEAQQPAPETTTAEPDAPPAIGEPASPEEARALVARLSDTEVRELLLERLDAVARERERAQAEELRSFFSGLEAFAERFVENFPTAFHHAPQLPAAFAKAYAAIEDERPISWIFVFLAKLGVLISIAGGSSLLVAALTRRSKERMAASTPKTLTSRARALAARFFLDVIAVAFAFFAAFALSFALFERNSLEQRLAIDIVAGVAIVRFGYMLARFILTPSRRDLRLLPVGDACARRMTRSAVFIFAAFALQGGLMNFMDRAGVSVIETRLGFWMNLLVHLTFIYHILRHRRFVSEIVAGGSEPGAWARNWPFVLSAAIASIWLIVVVMANTGFVHSIRSNAIFVTLLLLMFVPVIDTALRAIALELSRDGETENDAARDRVEARLFGAYLRCGRVVIGALSLMAIIVMWGVDLDALRAAGLAGRLGEALIDSVFTIMIGYALWEAIGIFGARQLLLDGAAGADPNAEAGGEGGGQGASRLGTVAPLLIGGGKALVVILTTLAVLSEAGINVAPLIAGAGVIGLAIGFGAQTLVKDVVSGLFFLIDDAFRVGEYVDIGGTMGTVEKISIRSLRLRHHRGALHTVPYGEIAKLTNYSRDWVIVKLKFRVPFETDVNLVKRIFKQIGKDLLKHPEIGEDFLQPFKSQGVFDFDDSGIVVRGKFMTKPGKQFIARREVYVAVQKAFEEHGIDFARRQVMVQLPESAEPAATNDAERLRRAAAAAAETVAAQEDLAAKASPS